MMNLWKNKSSKHYYLLLAYVKIIDILDVTPFF